MVLKVIQKEQSIGEDIGASLPCNLVVDVTFIRNKQIS